MKILIVSICVLFCSNVYAETKIKISPIKIVCINGIEYLQGPNSKEPIKKNNGEFYTCKSKNEVSK